MATGIGEAAAIVGLASTALSLVREIQLARERMHGASKILNDHGQELDSLIAMVNLVESEPALQTASIATELQNIIKGADELRSYLKTMESHISHNITRLYMHTLVSGGKDERDIASVLAKLDRAKNGLGISIQLANVGLTRTLGEGFVAVLPVIERINRNVEKVLGAGLRIAILLQDRVPPHESSTIQLTDADIDTLGLNATLPFDKRSYINNNTLDQGLSLNGDTGAQTLERPSIREYKGNKSSGKGSIQINGNTDIESLKILLLKNDK